MHIVRCALDLGALPPPIRREGGFHFRLISVARLSPEKGHSGLLQAFARSRTSDCELVLVGDGPERARLEQQVKDLHLQSCVTFLGALPESETLREIAKSDALVLASFIEGLPVVLMEAMALGKPVIAPHLAGIPDMIQHRENGLLFDPADWNSLQDQLYVLLRHPPTRSKLSVTGRATIERNFDVNTAVKPLIACFKDLHERADSKN